MKNLGTVTLETERLILRKTRQNDAEQMFRNWANNERVTKYMTWPPYESVEQLETTYHKFLLDNQGKPDFYDWKIELKDICEPIGAISVVQLRENIEAATIGYCLGYNWWHKGIMSEAFIVLFRFLFVNLVLYCIESYDDPRNPLSGVVMLKR